MSDTDGHDDTAAASKRIINGSYCGFERERQYRVLRTAANWGSHSLEHAVVSQLQPVTIMWKAGFYGRCALSREGRNLDFCV